MQYHQTDDQGYFVGTETAEESPNEHAQYDDAGVMVSPASFLIPAGGVRVAPPMAGIKQAARFVAGAWMLVPDFRGVSYWLADGSLHIVTDRGTVPPVGAFDAPPGVANNTWDGAAFVARVMSLAEVKSREVVNVTDAAARKLDRIDDLVRRALVKLAEGVAVPPLMLAKIKKNDTIEDKRDAAIIEINAATTRTAARAVAPAVVWP